jgi:hypothetical protein
MTTYVMRTFQVATRAIATFVGGMTVGAPEANAVVYCAAGVYRAGCVARPAYYGATVYGPTVNGVARRCAAYDQAAMNCGEIAWRFIAPHRANRTGLSLSGRPKIAGD